MRPFYDEKAKARQVRKADFVQEKIPQLAHEAKSRDEAGKVAEDKMSPANSSGHKHSHPRPFHPPQDI